jgi:hypothetical protein
MAPVLAEQHKTVVRAALPLIENTAQKSTHAPLIASQKAGIDAYRQRFCVFGGGVRDLLSSQKLSSFSPRVG